MRSPAPMADVLHRRRQPLPKEFTEHLEAGAARVRVRYRQTLSLAANGMINLTIVPLAGYRGFSGERSER